jgi:hypothetical protein
MQKFAIAKQVILEHKDNIQKIEHLSELWIEGIKQPGYEVHEDIEMTEPLSLELIEFRKDVPFCHEEALKTIFKRIFVKSTDRNDLAGRKHAALLLAQQDKIPREWQCWTLVFAGTKWINPERKVLVLCLQIRREDEWGCRWRSIDESFSDGCLLVRFFYSPNQQ